MIKAIVIFGSSRKNGNTMQVVRAVLGQKQIQVINISEQMINFYDYQHRNSNDHFIKIAEDMILSDIIIFATPIYWYAMSGQLKIFFDRMTDLIQIRKDLGRALKGKECYVIASGTDPKLPPGFTKPFFLTCTYFGMRYKETFYYHVKKQLIMYKEAKMAATKFEKKIFG